MPEFTFVERVPGIHVKQCNMKFKFSAQLFPAPESVLKATIPIVIVVALRAHASLQGVVMSG